MNMLGLILKLHYLSQFPSLCILYILFYFSWIVGLNWSQAIMFWVTWVTSSSFPAPFSSAIRHEAFFGVHLFRFVLGYLYLCFLLFAPLVSFNLSFVQRKRRVVLRCAPSSPGSSTLWPCIIEHTAAWARSAAHNTQGH